MQSTQIEKWKPVVGYEGLYEVSDHGRVKSLHRATQRILRPSVTSKFGHLSVTLCRKGAERGMLVHRLVAIAFFGPPPQGTECCHIDGDASNNNASNLRWGTRVSNMQDMVRHGRNARLNKTRCPRGHLLQLPNLRASALKRGQRACRACDLAWRICDRREIPFNDEIAHEKYRQIMNG